MASTSLFILLVKDLNWAGYVKVFEFKNSYLLFSNASMYIFLDKALSSLAFV